MSSKSYEESGYGLDLDLLAIAYQSHALYKVHEILTKFGISCIITFVY